MSGESVLDFAHDAEVVVFNYKNRVTEPPTFAGPPGFGDLAGNSFLDVDRIQLRDAIVGIQCQKSKGQPQGTFAITLKATKEWTKVLVPGSWCAIFMSNKTLTSDDLTPVANADDNGNYLAPLKMMGMIMAVRTQKRRGSKGETTLVYTVTGYDFGYAFLSGIYINHTFQQFVSQGLAKGPYSELNFPTDNSIYGNPAENIQKVLQGWSVLSANGVPGNVAGGIAPPSIRMLVPDDVAGFMGTGPEILDFIGTVIGVDQRTDKVVDVQGDGTSDNFSFDLVGQKAFMVWQLIVNNTLWGMINQYLNPILNEAYCDLHVTGNFNSSAGAAGSLQSLKETAPGSGGNGLRPLLVVRQIPFNTPQYNDYWKAGSANAGSQQPYEVTTYVNLPYTTIPAEKVIGYDIGYSDYERINFVEVNGFDKDLAKNSPGAFNDVNMPRFEEGAIRRFGLRPKVFFGADYGAIRGNIAETGYWSPLLQDWWFNSNKYANGTLDCIGLLEHIAIGENFVLDEENILGHIESYTHTFHVDDKGNRVFRTQIDFVRGIAADSTETQYKYIYGDQTFGGDFAIQTATGDKSQDTGIFQQFVDNQTTFTSVRPIK